MNKKQKGHIRDVFEAPAPKRKTAFLSSVNFPKTTRSAFIVAQIGYIRKRVWVVTFLAIAPVLLMLSATGTENIVGFIWGISSLLPFLVLVGITEVARSLSHNMAELESSCKYGLSNVVLARLGIIGSTHMTMFAIVLAAFRIAGHREVWRLATYLFVPFLLTCALSLFTVNYLRVKENTYICGGIACLVSIANAFLSNQYAHAFTAAYIPLWGMAFFVLLLWTVGETYKLMQRLGELQWNLSLTA